MAIVVKGLCDRARSSESCSGDSVRAGQCWEVRALLAMSGCPSFICCTMQRGYLREMGML